MTGRDAIVTSTGEGLLEGFAPVGPREYLDRLLLEYDLSEADVEGLVAVRRPTGVGGKPGSVEYLIHKSVLRSHREFPCAADRRAVDFCREIAQRMVTSFGIGRQEAVARINRAWTKPDKEDDPSPRVWVVGLDIAYHETVDYWANTIYYGRDSRWWLPGAHPQPLPPPS